MKLTGGTMTSSRAQREAVETTVDASIRRTWKFTPMTRYGDELPAGPWDDEPDKIQWVDKATDLDCLMLRNGFGAWCGYVGVPQSHPLHGVDYNECTTPGCMGDCYDESPPHLQPDSLVDVHGGLTFAARCSPGEPIDGVCHIAEPGREAAPWWFGFDCGHFGDAQPSDFFYERKYGGAFTPVSGTYRTEQYVQGVVGDLAAQLAVVK